MTQVNSFTEETTPVGADEVTGMKAAKVVGSERRMTISNLTKGLAQATETAQGVAEIATTTEAQAGTNDVNMSTPKKVQDQIDANAIAFVASRFIGSLSGDTAFQALTPAELRTTADVPLTTQKFDIQFNIDVSGGNADFVIHDDTAFAYTIDSVNALVTDIGTLTAGVEINTTAVTGISVAVTTTKQTVADPSTAANSVVATDEVSIAVTAVASSPTRLTGVLHATRVLDN